MKEQKKGESVSLLFMICSPVAEVITVEGESCIVIPAHDSVVIYFSDRPYRFAGRLQGGIDEFYQIYKESNFQSDPPNVTFTGGQDGTSSISYSVFKTGTPRLESDYVLLPYNNILSGSQPLPASRYSGVSLVVDPWGLPLLKRNAGLMISRVHDAAKRAVVEATIEAEKGAAKAAEHLGDKSAVVGIKTNDKPGNVRGNQEAATQSAEDRATEPKE